MLRFVTCQDIFQIIIEIKILEAFPEAVFYDCASRERDLVLSLTNLAKQRCWANFLFETVRLLVDMIERQRASSTPQTWLIKLCTLPYVDSKIFFFDVLTHRLSGYKLYSKKHLYGEAVDYKIFGIHSVSLTSFFFIPSYCWLKIHIFNDIIIKKFTY